MRSAMEAFAERGWPAELIVCDNNSDDRTAQIARAAGARVVFEPVNQIARARNTGAAHAAGEWLIFIDADSHPSRELFAEAAEAMQGGLCLAGGATLAFPGCAAMARSMLRLVRRPALSQRGSASGTVRRHPDIDRYAGAADAHLHGEAQLPLGFRAAQERRARIAGRIGAVGAAARHIEFEGAELLLPLGADLRRVLDDHPVLPGKHPRLVLRPGIAHAVDGGDLDVGDAHPITLEGAFHDRQLRPGPLGPFVRLDRLDGRAAAERKNRQQRGALHASTTKSNLPSPF